MKKKMLSILLSAGLMMGLAAPAFAAETYEVPVKLMNYHETAKESMANKSLKPTAVAVVDGNTTEIKLALKPMEMSGVISSLFSTVQKKLKQKKKLLKANMMYLQPLKSIALNQQLLILLFGLMRWINSKVVPQERVNKKQN